MGITDEQQQKLQQLVNEDKDQLADGELTSRVKLALQRKYDFPEWALFFEVPGKTGRQADAIGFNMFPSRNFKTIGFEVKVSRSDWKKELEDISKADYFVGQCDEWYVVAGRKGIVKESELPEGWGLLEMKGGGKLYTIVESELTEHQNRAPDREFYARGIQKAMKRAKERRREKNRARREGYREGKEEGKKIGTKDDREYKRMQRKAEKFEKLRDAGIEFWDEDETIQRIKTAMYLLDQLDEEGLMNLRSRINGFDRYLEKVQERIDDMEELAETLQNELHPDFEHTSREEDTR